MRTAVAPGHPPQRCKLTCAPGSSLRLLFAVPPRLFPHQSLKMQYNSNDEESTPRAYITYVVRNTEY